MGGSVPYGKCDICGKEDILHIKYYRYDLDCECCGGAAKDYHFERLEYCENCKPKAPHIIRPHLVSKTYLKEMEKLLKEENK